MAPRKEKAEKTSADQGKPTIRLQVEKCHGVYRVTYILHSSRPNLAISPKAKATDISANLKNAVTKAAAAKHLKDLHERNQIEGRSSGKQIVYHAIQEPSDPSNNANIAKLDATLTALRTETGTLSTQLRNAKTQLSALNNSLTTSQLHETISDLSKELAMLEKRLVPLRAGGGTPALSKEEKELLIKREQYWKTACEKRAKIKKDLWSLVRDALPEEMKAEDIAERLGIED